MVSIRTLTLANMYQLATLAVVAGLAWLGWRDGLSGLLLGGAITSLNFMLMRTLGARVLASTGPKAAYALALGLKFMVLLALVAVTMIYIQPNVVAFALGMGTLFVGVALSMLHQACVSGAARVSA